MYFDRKPRNSFEIRMCACVYVCFNVYWCVCVCMFECVLVCVFVSQVGRFG